MYNFSPQLAQSAHHTKILHYLYYHAKNQLMDTTKKILNISLALGLVLCSLSLFIFSIKSNTAGAQQRMPPRPGGPGGPGGYIVAGIVSSGVNHYDIIGYNPENGGVKVLAKYPAAK